MPYHPLDFQMRVYIVMFEIFIFTYFGVRLGKGLK